MTDYVVCPWDLQERVGSWHRQRFPTASELEIMVKACAELGELAEAIGSRCEGSPNARGDRLAEAADVLICLFAVIDRYEGGDPLEAVERKLAILSDPASGHRSAITVPRALLERAVVPM